MNILVTGGAGFIGSHLVDKLLSLHHRVIVIDNFDKFYDREIKLKNLSNAFLNSQFTLLECNIEDYSSLTALRIDENIHIIIHLAAKAGVRPSILHPADYQRTNLIGTQNLLEFARIKHVKQFVFASSSSVYGINSNIPWVESDNTLLPISPYASSKISGELIGRVYSHLHNINFIALRFFTVYGPRQRPDLAIYKFARSIIDNKPIHFFGEGNTKRDYTYVSDVVDAIIATLSLDLKYEILNIGNSYTVSLQELLFAIETVFEKKAIINQLPIQEGDVPVTFADITKAKKILGYSPKISLYEGLYEFKKWFDCVQK